jgi:hypothetical protein
MTSISTIAPQSLPETAEAPTNKKRIELSEAATLLLPGLQHAQSLLTVAIQVLSHFAPPPSTSAPSPAEAAAKIRRLLNEFGRTAARRQA